MPRTYTVGEIKAVDLLAQTKKEARRDGDPDGH